MAKLGETRISSNHTTWLPGAIRTHLGLEDGSQLDWHLELVDGEELVCLRKGRKGEAADE